ncbi:heme exporter protein CcmB [Paraburkholderia xenovorans LB400]|uniref:Heme exporter protein B n=1 Tax=Paraburkholderia xenovorans (strain LB400) TaxID=266265 RepID=Q13I11_PARXL|nr:heme exporter protein CcmB [Paraburkholderia xenovorans]ABE36278.1 ABC heme exporter, inner membrane subunit CcmB [Paraburkholderia xenovorans LB400]AIP34607.1 heme exporter protein CcmB [Paraburkholderia xenovorans LB400]
MAGLTLGVIRRELALTWRRRTVTLGSLMFFVIASSLFPLAVGPDPKLLQAIAPGVLWVTALLAAMLSAGHLFAQDFASGTLEQMLLSPWPLPGIVFGKIVAHWLTGGLAQVLLAPVVALQYELGWRATLPLMGSLLLGTPLLSLIGSMGAALTLGVRGGGVTLALVILPLYVPVLIFGVSASDPGTSAAWSKANFSLLGAALCAAGLLCPWASAVALRIALE